MTFLGSSKFKWVINPLNFYVSGPTPQWILTTGFWVTTNTVWDDNATWNDGV